MTPASPERAPLGGLLSIALAFALGRAALSCGVLPACGAGLGDTEAYYTAWSMDLAWGYHDHPGLLAWLLALTRAIGGASSVGTRLTPALCLGGAALLWTACWGRLGRREAAWGLAAFAAAPILASGGLLAAPDGPLALGWAAAVYATLAMRQRPAWGLLLAGAAAWMLAAKLVGGVLVAALAAEALWSHGPTRAACARLAALASGAALGLAPTLAFEAAHGFTGLRYHLLERHTGDTPFALAHWGALLGGQLLALSPLLALLLAGGLWARRGGGSPPAARTLWRLSLLSLLPLALMAAYTREAEPHWPVLGWLPALGLGAAEAARRWPRLWRGALALGTLLQAAVWLHVATPLFMPLLPDSYEPRFDLAQDLQGWDRVAQEARQQLQRGDVEAVVGYHYTVCGQLAANLGALEPVACLSQRRDAFDFLRGGASGQARPGARLLYVRDNRYDEPGPQRLRCDAWGEERWIVIERGGRVVRRFGLQPCLGYQGIVTVSNP